MPAIDIREKAQKSESLVQEVNAVVLAEPTTEVVPYDAAEGEVKAEISKRMDEIDISSTGSIVSFGSSRTS